MLIAAFTSRSCRILQLGQVHSLIVNVSSLFMYPQQEQVLLLGSNLPIFRMFLPYHKALYSNCLVNSPHDTSLIACAKLWFLTMLDTARSSIQMLSWFLTNIVEVLCKKSLRWLAIFSCSFASLYLVLLPFFLECLRCIYFNFESFFLRNLGLSIISPSEVTRNDLIPKSMPTLPSLVTKGLVGIDSPVSQRIETKYLLVGVLLIVACLIVPFISRCKTISIPFLNLGMISLLPFSDILCGMLKELLEVFFLNLGKSALPLKKLVKAVSIFVMDCCNDCELTSFNQSFPFFSSGSLLIKSKQLKLLCVAAYSLCLVSSIKLYTNLQLPTCLLISTFCSSVGFNLYLKAFNIVSIV